jgi:two-component system sensor histidine kinase KdpD
MNRTPLGRIGRIGHLLAVAVGSLAIATILVALLQDGFGVSNASTVYLVAVVAAALLSGTAGAIATSIGSFLLYDYLFTDPRYALTVSHPGEWLSVVLLLFVGVVVGQLAALQRSQTEVARAREREARAQFQLSRALATRESTPAVLPEVTRILVTETAMRRIWIALGIDDAGERIAADTGSGERSAIALVHVLQRKPGDTPAEWVRVHQPAARVRPVAAKPLSGEAYRVRIEADDRPYGSIWAEGDRGASPPDRSATRLLSAAADLVGLALAHDRLAAEAQAAEIARASDALKSALLQSVSHDLRTPLAAIRAAAGTLRPESGLDAAGRLESAAAIDREVQYLDRLVTNLLDLSRIEAGALRAERDVFELDDLLGPVLERLRGRLGDRPIEVDLGAPPVLVDPIFLDDAVTNVLENAAKYTPPGSRIRISARATTTGSVRLTIEDVGPGVPEASLPRLFEKFYRVPRPERPSRAGTGIGLAVARGLVEAMGASIGARRGALGGLAVDIDLVPAQAVQAAAAVATA